MDGVLAILRCKDIAETSVAALARAFCLRGLDCVADVVIAGAVSTEFTVSVPLTKLIR